MTVKKRKTAPAFRVEYDALENGFAALDALLHARNDACLTQGDVAAKMGVTQPVVARIESSLKNRKNSPSLTTLSKYAVACGRGISPALVSPTSCKWAKHQKSNPVVFM